MGECLGLGVEFTFSTRPGVAACVTLAGLIPILIIRRAIFVCLWLAIAGWVRAANPALPVIPSTVFNVTNYAAVGDGIKDNTTNIQNAIDAAGAAGGGIVEIPAGVFLSGPITVSSSLNLRVDTNATLMMLPLGRYPGGTSNAQTFITCNGIHDLEISGQGTLDGQGAAWWTYYNTNNTISRPMILNLYTVNRLFIHDVTYKNPPNHHCGLRSNGGNILISNLTVNTTANSPNTDGLNFVATNSIIENCHISDGDDNIAMGSTGPIYDLLITNCVFGTGHGVSFGSGISGVTNVTVINCSFTGTGNGLRIKCARDNSQPIKNLNYLNLAMTNVGIPIVFYSYYDFVGTPDHIPTTTVLAASNSLPINASTPNWSNITISNLTATATDIGGIIWGPTEWPVTNVTLSHVTITAPKTFDLYNVRGVKVIDSTFNFSSGTTFTLCNADLTVSNSTTGGKAVSIGGAASANSLALCNVNAFMSSTDAFTCSPLSLSASVLTNTGTLTFSTNAVINFALGTNKATIVITGGLNLNGTLNFTNAGGFTNASYTLFTYTGSLGGLPTIGTTPAGYSCTLDTGTAGQVKVAATFTGTTFIPTTNSLQSTANPSTYGTAVTFTATITPAPTNGETVVFKDGLITMGAGALSAGQASFTTTTNQLAAGMHSITAVYAGDGAYGASTSMALSQAVNAARPPPGTLFSDTFGLSTVNPSTPAAPTSAATSYEVVSSKSWNPTPTITPGRLAFGIGSTSSGVIEVQALFKTVPFSLNAAGDYIQLTVTFTNTAGILTQSGAWGFGLYSSGGAAPTAGGLNSTMTSAFMTAGTGGAQNWQGYWAQIGFTGATSGFYDRQAQSTASANNDQDLVTTGSSSSSYQNPPAAAIGTPTTAPSVTLTVGAQYTEVLTYTLMSAPDTLQLASQLYAGPDTNGTLLSSMNANPGAPALTTAFDALAFGWRATGSTASQMTVSSISVTGQQTLVTGAPAVLGAMVSGSTLTLGWPNSPGWLLQSNATGLATTNWSMVPGSGNVTNLSIAIDPGVGNVFYRLVAP